MGSYLSKINFNAANPFKYDMNLKSVSVGTIITALAIIAALAGVLAILAASGVSLGPFNAFGVLTYGGGSVFLILGAVASATGLTWIAIKGYKAYLERKNTEYLGSHQEITPKEPEQALATSIVISTDNTQLSPIYAHKNRSVEEKLAHQLTEATCSGFLQEESKNFKLYPDDDVKKYIVAHKNKKMGIAETDKPTDVHFDLTITTNNYFLRNSTINVTGLVHGYEDEGKIGQIVKEKWPQKIMHLVNASDKESIVNGITRSLIELNEEIKNQEGLSNSCSAAFIAALRFKKAGYLFKNNDEIYIPNVGNSRAVLCKKNKAFQLSEDAVLGNLRFQRGRKKPSKIKKDDTSIARALGMESYPRPKITCITKGNGDDEKSKIFYRKGDYLVLATREFWKAATIDEVRRAIFLMENNNVSLNEMAAHLVNGAIKKRVQNNLTVMIYKVG